METTKKTAGIGKTDAAFASEARDQQALNTPLPLAETLKGMARQAPPMSNDLKKKADAMIAARDRKKAPKAATRGLEKAVAKVTVKARAAGKRAEKTTAANATDLVTFAFRLPRAESAKIHKAAGPGKASWFAREILVAAATGNLDRIEEIVEKGR